ncbi:MAG: hypothetical protein PUF13_04610, partial [Lachnospiraceae bacterium]|nr:hypothetical protein [Lachnospiraceae bacterium]
AGFPLLPQLLSVAQWAFRPFLRMKRQTLADYICTVCFFILLQAAMQATDRLPGRLSAAAAAPVRGSMGVPPISENEKTDLSRLYLHGLFFHSPAWLNFN